MDQVRNVGSVSDQTPDIFAARACLAADDLLPDTADHRVLRRLAEQVAELAARPIEAEKRQLWTRHNKLERTRPVIFCDPENGWNEIFPAEQLQCKSPITRQWEFRLRKELFWGTRMHDDYTIRPHFDVPHVFDRLDWGLRETRIGDVAEGAYNWKSPIKTDADVDKLHFPEVRVDHDATARIRDLAEHIFGDVLGVRTKTIWWWTVGLTRELSELRGMEQMMLDMCDNPDLIHRIMAILRDGTMALLDQLEEQGLLGVNNDGTYVGSGGLGWSDELPRPGHTGALGCADMWGFAESQETVGISPRMFDEFVFPYQEPILKRFGLTCYGCCEPLDKRWHVIEKLPNLRRVSVSPWADNAFMAERLGNRYVFSMKCNPVDLAMDTFDEERIRALLREALQVTRDCCVELIMKDNHTIRSDTRRVIRWVEIAREEVERLA